jgi:hypothetical protein
MEKVKWNNLMNRAAKIDPMDWKFWSGFLCLLILGAGLRLLALTSETSDHLEVISAIAWLIGGFFIYVLSYQFSSPMGAMICLAYYYLLPLGIITDQANPTGALIVFWLVIASYGLYRLHKKRNIFWIGWGLFCLVTLILEFIILEPSFLANLGEKIIETLKLIISPVFYISWFEKVHGNMDLFLVLISLAAIFLLSKPSWNFFISLWLIYIIAALAFPAQAMNNAYFHQLLIPIVAISIGVFGDSIYLEGSKRGKIWRNLLLAVFVVAVLISAGYAWKRMQNAAELNAILLSFRLSFFS